MQNINSRPEAMKVGSGQKRHHGKLRSKLGLLEFVPALPFVAQPAQADEGAAEKISIVMSSSIVRGQQGEGNARKVFSRTVVYYSVAVMEPKDVASPTTSFAVSDAIPDQMSLFVGDLGAAGSGPVEFVENDSGLEFAFDGLAGPDDVLEFSNNNGITFEYVPVADDDGYDENVTHIRIALRGALMPTTGKYIRFSMRYKMRVK